MFDFGGTIKFLRENLGYTQKEIAQIVGLTQSNYSKIERNIQEPNLSQLKKLAETLKFCIDDVLEVDHENISKTDLALRRDMIETIKKLRKTVIK